MDDGLAGSDSLSTALETKDQLSELCSFAGMNLRKWCANHPKQGTPQEDQEVNIDFTSEDDDIIKTLGLLWLPKNDQFCVRSNISNVISNTKRKVISEIGRIFDPLGLMAPVTVTAKIFIQKLWKENYDWDTPFPKNLQDEWYTFSNGLRNLSNIKIRRHIFNGQLCKSFSSTSSRCSNYS